ncbi:MAG: response regulator [Ignavibacteriae bacterium]|nr:response regulator [Ignavibacteriota bacterium]NOG97098.1 response regulator [Ignavibacteriota bacterium]
MSGTKILVVEDNHIISEELKLRLELLGYEVCGIAHKAKQAISMVSKLKPNLVLMDIVLNDDMDGIEAAKIIGKKYHVPIIYLTAYADDDTISKAKDTNPYGYIIKPFNEVILKSSIEIALNKYYLENKLRENESILSSTLGSLDEAIFRTDEFGKILFMNESAEILTGKNLDSCLNKKMAEIFDIEIMNSSYSFNELINPVLHKGESVSRCSSKFLNVPAECSTYIEISAMPIKDAADKISGCVLVFHDITKRVEIESKLMEAKNRAEFASKIKSEFLAQMSHEIRTPVNAMLSFASLIREEVEDQVNNEVKEHFSILDNAGKRMAKTIDLLLSMAELQSGSYKTKLIKTDFYKDIVENVYLTFAHKAHNKKLEFNVSKLTDDFETVVDVNSARQTISNLVDNAIKYTKQGKIEIRISRNESNRLIVEIIDTGIGISKEYQKDLFMPFTQEDQSYTRRYEGTGLGLALAKKYCELNNADIEFESKKSVGSTFRVMF